jgi:hypothetical protein
MPSCPLLYGVSEIKSTRSTCYSLTKKEIESEMGAALAAPGSADSAAKGKSRTFYILNGRSGELNSGRSKLSKASIKKGICKS